MNRFICRFVMVVAAILLATTAMLATSPSGSLPVLYINTENHVPITSKETYVRATYYLDPMGKDGVQAFGSKDAPLPLQIKGRGNYTWNAFDKKPYRLKLDAKAGLLGFRKNKHFGLLAHADDNKGFLRNAVGFKLSEMIGLDWTPGQQPVEVVLNGDYIGLYFLTELIRVDKDRVNIVEQPDNISHPDSITGGWLVEIDNYRDDPNVIITEYGTEEIVFTYKTPEALSAAQEGFLRTQMTAINTAIYTTDKSSTAWEQYIDIESLARFYIVQELMDNYESFHGSCYLYRDMGRDCKWKFGPVWDFGSSFVRNKTQYLYQGDVWHNTWIPELCRFPRFINRVKAIWQEFQASKLAEVYPFIDQYTSDIALAAKADRERWPRYGNEDVAACAAQIKQWLANTTTWLRKQWGGQSSTQTTYHVFFVDNGSPAWQPVKAYIWDNVDPYPNYTGGWPGKDMIWNEAQERWEYTLAADRPLSAPMIIFNNGKSGVPDNQTADLTLIDWGHYDRTGLQSVSVNGINTDADALQVWATRGVLHVESANRDFLSVYRADGTFFTLNLQPGHNTFTLPRGFYVVDGRKVIL